MANLVYTDSQHYQDIANAIRNKNGTNNTYTPAQMATAINALDGSGNGTLTLQSKSVSPTESIQVITPDTGYDGLDQVNVGAISSTYIGSGITQRSSTDLSTSGATVTAPAGYYATAASKSVTTMTLPTAAAASATSGYTSKATINRSASAQYINIPPGYNNAGGYYTISATPNMTLPTSASTTSSGTSKLTITPTTANRYINIPTGYNGTASYYTIGGDANLIADNIKSGVSIFGIAGNFTGSGGTSKNTQITSGVGRVAATAYTAVSGQTLTVAKTGTYDIYWTGYRSSTSGTSGSQLYIGNTAYDSAQTTFNSTYTNVQNVHLTNVSLTANQTITVRARSRNTSSYMYIMNLTIIEQ